MKKQKRKESDSKENKKDKSQQEKSKENEVKKSKEEGLEKTLEEETKEIKEENKKEEEFEEFIENVSPIVTKAPVLERISRMTQAPIQEEIEIPNREKREERRIDYSTSSNQPDYTAASNAREQEERKYESNFVPLVLSRRESESIRQELLLPPDKLWRNENSSMNPQFVEWDTFDNMKKLPFETEQKKYKPFRIK